MEKADATQNLRFEYVRLDMLTCKEGPHIWKNLIRIEQLKREKLREKNELLRKRLQTH